MLLYYSALSPYARKVRVTALELGLRLELENVDVLDLENGFGRINPVNRIPALRTDEGNVLFDSPVICEFLDTTYGPKLLPASGEARWKALTLQALGDGIMDAAVPRRHETIRPREQQSERRIKLYERSMRDVLDHLESRVDDLEPLNVGSIAVAAAIGYVDFRFASDGWDHSRPKLRAWVDEMFMRPSFQNTPLS